jgi:hypothetical protein
MHSSLPRSENVFLTKKKRRKKTTNFSHHVSPLTILIACLPHLILIYFVTLAYHFFIYWCLSCNFVQLECCFLNLELYTF